MNKIQSKNAGPTCFAHRHMSFADYGIYNVVKAWAYQKSAKVKGTLFMDGNRISREFGVGSKSTVYNFRDRMVEAGWLVHLDSVTVDSETGKKIKKRNKRNGKLSSERYKVLTHEQWAAAHPGACALCRAAKGKDSPLGEEIEEDSPFQPEGLDDEESIPATGTGPFQIEDSPFQPEGLVHSSLETHHSSQRDITGSELVQGTRAETGKEERVRPQAAFPKFPYTPLDGGPLKDSEAAKGRSAIPARGNGPFQSEGLVVFRGVDEGYFDSVTGKKLYFDDISARVAPNTYQSGRFYDPSGKEITLDEAQAQKELVTA